jgi:uncharacterized membrane protein HdeD (DUF308 family)
VAGVDAAEVINAFQIKTWGHILVRLVLGVLYMVAGFLTFENPLLAAASLRFLLGVLLSMSGIVRLVLAFGRRREYPGSASRCQA